MIRITECPRDAMQGIKEYIPAHIKANYINRLLKAGFEKIDFGSFVSPKAVPQMRDTADVLKMLELDEDSPELLAIVANKRGAEDAAFFEEISFLGYPFSVSETFQKKNTNATIEESLERVENIKKICDQTGKKLLIYISMAFGNPYGDEWHPDIVTEKIAKLKELDINDFALADTVGVSDESNIKGLFETLINKYPEVSFSAHLHSHPRTSMRKIKAAYESGCRKFDSAIRGFGGCPMAEDDLVGNISTEDILKFAEENKIANNVNAGVFLDAMNYSNEVFNR